jgi:HEAT repeats
MASQSIQAASLTLSVAALIVATVAVLHRPDPPIVEATGDDAREHQIQELSNQVAQLRASIDLNRAPGEASSRQPVLDPTPEQGSKIAELQKRVSELEAAVAALRRSASPPQLGAEKAPSKDVAEARRVILDPRASEKDKLAAMRALRGMKVNGQEALSHDLVLSLLDLVDRSEDASARQDVYRNLHRINDPALRDSMLRSLTSDSSPLVREQCAKDIDTFLPDAAIEAALQSAADADTNERVRSEALKSLAHKN